MWFIYFDKEILSNNPTGFPRWFIEWFSIHRPTKSILPKAVLDKYEFFRAIIPRGS